jgi:hypothetical protein
LPESHQGHKLIRDVCRDLSPPNDLLALGHPLGAPRKATREPVADAS